MATNLYKQHAISRSSLLLVSLLALVGIVSGCGASLTAGPSHLTGLTPTSTATRQLKGTISEIPLPTPNFYPGGMMAGPGGALWFIESDSNNKHYKIGRITTEGTISEFPVSANLTQLYGLTNGSDGNLWFVAIDYNKLRGVIGRITPSGTISEFPVPELISNVYGIVAGLDGNLWYIVDPANHSQSDKIGRITPTGKISEFPPPNLGTVPGGITTGPDGKIWFTEMNSNKIGRLV